jgi:hypothetical protein
MFRAMLDQVRRVPSGKVTIALLAVVGWGCIFAALIIIGTRLWNRG